MNTSKLTRFFLGVLALFSFVAVSGYWIFGLHPENLARFPQAASFYATSFSFFAQTQIILSVMVLVVLLSQSKSLGWVKGLAAVYVLSLGSELLGTLTGFPFGDYQYTGLLGPMWLDSVPVLIPASWATMVIPAFILVERLFKDKLATPWRMAISAALLTSWDLVLDPAMSFLVPYWTWGQEGAFYGMPLINLFGWFITGYILSYALHILGTLESVSAVGSRSLIAFYVIVFALPAGMLLAAGHIVLVLLVTSGILIFCASCIIASRLLSDRNANLGPDNGSAPDDLGGHLGRIAEKTDSYFEKHSRSFSFSSVLFSSYDKMRVSNLYAFCRMTDDIADEPGLDIDIREKLLAEWEAIVKRSYEGTPSGIVWLDRLMKDLKCHGLPFSVLEDLIEGVRSDLYRTRFKSQEELATYSYQVASTVGIMMCYLFDETDELALSRAASLGLGMQLTNIYRDVGSDLRIGRVYLPEDWLNRFGVTVDTLQSLSPYREIPEEYRRLLNYMEQMANLAYEAAWEAIPRLSWRFGPSVAAAALVYRGIHDEIRRNGYDNVHRRAFTSTGKKATLVFWALAKFTFGKALLRLDRLRPSNIRSSFSQVLSRNNMAWMAPYLSLVIICLT